MKVLNFIKKVVKAYIRVTAENYTMRCTGDVFIPGP